MAFDQVGLGWAQRVVAAGALTGIVTSLLGSLLGQARIYVTLGRQALAPAWLVGAGAGVMGGGVGDLYGPYRTVGRAQCSACLCDSEY